MTLFAHSGLRGNLSISDSQKKRGESSVLPEKVPSIRFHRNIVSWASNLHTQTLMVSSKGSIKNNASTIECILPQRQSLTHILTTKYLFHNEMNYKIAWRKCTSYCQFWIKVHINSHSTNLGTSVARSN